MHNTCAPSGTKSNRDDLLLRFPVIDCLMKYFWAWLATCVGDLVCTNCLEIPRQSPCDLQQKLSSALFRPLCTLHNLFDLPKQAQPEDDNLHGEYGGINGKGNSLSRKQPIGFKHTLPSFWSPFRKSLCSSSVQAIPACL